MADGTTAPATQYLTSVEVAGFKSAKAPVRVNFRDITVLAGANSAGKSTVMQPLLLIKQTIEKPYDPGGLAIDGPLVRFSHADELLSRVKAEHNAPIFTFAMTMGEDHLRLWYERPAGGTLSVAKMEFGRGAEHYSWSAGKEVDKHDGSLYTFIDDDNQNSYFHAMELVIPKNSRIDITPGSVALEANIFGTDKGDARVYRRVFVQMPAAKFVYRLAQTIYLPGLRGNPERSYILSAAGPRFPGYFNAYVASIVHHWVTVNDERLVLLVSHLKTLGLTSRITTRAVDDTRVEVHVGRLPASARSSAKDTVNIADVGFGVSQTLPVLVALLAAEPNQMVYIEQPELHLHPKAQIAMADILLQAANRGVRVVIETHSNLLLLALQAAVAEGRIAPDRVSLNWFTRDAAGQTHVTEAQLDADGSYGDWPEDFGENELKLQDRFMTAVERNHAR